MLSDYITSDKIKINLESCERDECLAELLEVMIQQRPEINRKEALQALIDREDKKSTAICPGIAVPHAICRSIKKSCLVIGVSKNKIDFGSTQSDPEVMNVKIIFEILFEENDAETHLKMLKDIVQLIQSPNFEKNVIEAQSAAQVFDIIIKSEI
ncbi:MAG: PTS sugar transporter subunit IIA [Treponema sp.]|nr:PTS sugar transporter subunit IIA [Treponema sp.]